MNDHIDCFYCKKDLRLQSKMTKIASLENSTLYLNNNQFQKGRCILALNEHKEELFQLSHSSLSSFMADVAKAAKSLKEVFHAEKINYAIYGDEVSHLHFHLVPKYRTTGEWGEAFVNNPLHHKEMPNDLLNQRILTIRKHIEG